jgi:hypothetical protein
MTKSPTQATWDDGSMQDRSWSATASAKELSLLQNRLQLPDKLIHVYIYMYIHIYWYSTYFSIFQNISKSNWKPTWRPLATVFHTYSYNFLFPLFPSISLTLKPPVPRRCSPIQFGSLSPGQRCQNGCLMTFYKPYRPCRHMQAIQTIGESLHR